MILEGGHTFLDGFRPEIPHQQKAIICMYDNNDVETNKVRSHKNYPKYLEYNKVIHVGIMYKI
jgi:hypothetical protein